MSSLVIGLDINDSHVTSALVRTGKSLSIERDTYFTRTYEINSHVDPREIISIWIQCINDLLIDFVNYFKDDDYINGISISMPGPMDYESGICFIETPAFNKFFGLNVRLSFEYGLRKLISQWKYNYYDKYRMSVKNESEKKLNILDKLYTSPRKRMTITLPTKPSTSMTLDVLPRTVDDFDDKKLTRQNIFDYCGRQDDDRGFYDEYDRKSSITRSRRETYFHDVDIDEEKHLNQITKFNEKFWSIIEKLGDVPISFHNDAKSFALGEQINDYIIEYKRILCLTLSTTFGSAFIDQGQIITDRDDIPLDGTLWNCPYDQYSIADDWFSTRGLISIYKRLLRQDSPDNSSGASSMTLSTDERLESNDNFSIEESYLARCASNGNLYAHEAFRKYARLLGEFLIPYIKRFNTDLILLGGNLAQYWYLIEDELNATINKFCQVQVYFSLSQGKAMCIGSVQQQLLEKSTKIYRRTYQNLLPVVKTIDTSEYDIYPSHEIPSGQINIGYRTLNEKLYELINKNQMILIDGFVGTYFNQYSHELNKYYLEKQSENNFLLASLLFYDSRAILKDDNNIDRDLYLNNPNSIFGRLASDLDFKINFIDKNKLTFLKSNLSYPCVVIGPGSSYVNEDSPLIYIDLSKNELYYRIETETSSSYLKPIRKLKTDKDQLTSKLYERKSLYFLDYPVFNKLKQEILPRIEYFIDGQRPNCPTWIDGNTLRLTCSHLIHEPIRVRPWFESDIWGGQWLKTKCKNISKYSKNYSYSYEMVPTENGIIFSDLNNHLMEISWDIFYGSQGKHILGNEIHYQFFNGSNDFPIRFNLIDTIDGGNTSIHCHPNIRYMHKNFGEKLTQDELFYVIDNKDSSYIYLGFNKNINADEFHRDLLLNQNQNQDFNIEKYVQCLKTNIHDCFLIPNETIHGLGYNQVALEISTTPYIYLFKLYDWIKHDLNATGNYFYIEHGMNNLRYERFGEQLRCKPISIKSEENKYEEENLPTHHLHIFDLQRIIIEPNENVEIIRSTENRFHLCMLVQGDAIEIKYNLNNKKRYNFIETFLIPASINEYSLRPIITTKKANKKFILLTAFLKWDCDKLV